MGVTWVVCIDAAAVIQAAVLTEGKLILSFTGLSHQTSASVSEVSEQIMRGLLMMSGFPTHDK